MFKRLTITLLMAFTLNAQSTQNNTKEIAAKYLKEQTKKAVEQMSEKSKAEYKKYMNLKVKDEEVKNMIIYFTSQSLDASYQINITKEIALLNESRSQKMVLVPIVRGLDEGVMKYAKRLYDELKTLPPLQMEEAKKATLTLKINPKMFEEFNITKVPAIVTARCTKKIPKVESCEFYYKAQGKTSLLKLAELVDAPISDLFKDNR